MILGSESDIARHGGHPSPILNDAGIQTLWMSSRARVTLGEAAGGLLQVQTRFLEHYFRLQNAERMLAEWTQATRPSAVSSAVRQVERERERLGRELHTGIGQLLVAIRLQLEAIASQLTNPAPAVQTALDRIVRLASDAGEQVRSLSHRLHPPEWQRLGLESAVQQLWETSGIPQRFDAQMRIDPLPREPEQEVKVLVYRAVQEALTNLVRHSQATRVEMTLEGGEGRVVLRIADNGIGFDVERFFRAPASVSQGLGLRSLREQAASLGGDFEIRSGADGTVLRLSAPFELPHA